MAEPADQSYELDPTDGIYVRHERIDHRAEQYDPAIFQSLLKMQERHFWYRGRHRFLFRALKNELKRAAPEQTDLRAVDLGGGCGGWLKYLEESSADLFQELALADSSRDCLVMARQVVSDHVRRYHTDLRDLRWENRWDVIFLLDVLEHLPDDVEVVQQVAQALQPGGLLFVTTPALDVFWSSNDELVNHVRRYSRKMYAELAENTGLQLCYARYFMFFLSPLLWLRRRSRVDAEALSETEKQILIERDLRIPPGWLNHTLTAVFSLETPLGLWLPFPWGTSVLGVFRKV